MTLLASTFDICSFAHFYFYALNMFNCLLQAVLPGVSDSLFFKICAPAADLDEQKVLSGVAAVFDAGFVRAPYKF